MMVHCVGSASGEREGVWEGERDGALVVGTGERVGERDGPRTGDRLGECVGRVGACDGECEGALLGARDGLEVVGAALGDGVPSGERHAHSTKLPKLHACVGPVYELIHVREVDVAAAELAVPDAPFVQ